MAQPAEPATVHLQSAEDLVTSIAGDIAPGVTVSVFDSDQQQGRTAPLKGQIYYTISRQFTVQNSGTALRKIDSALKSRGYKTVDDYESNEPSLRASNGVNEMNVVTDPSSGLVRFNIDTQCGTPPTSSSSS